MKPVLAVIGIALIAVLLSIVTQRPKDLTPRPMDREEARRDAQQKEIRSTAAGGPSADVDEPFDAPREGALTAVMTVEGRGDVTIELYPKAAPQTVEHFASLIKKKFYDGILFHRVIASPTPFVAQTGDPNSKKFKPADLATKSEQEVGAMGLGQSGSGTNVPFESNNLKHVRGTISLALSAAKSDTGDSQFFINLSPNHSLDGGYCVFGKVVQGMDVVKKIKQGDRIAQFVIR